MDDREVAQLVLETIGIGGMAHWQIIKRIHLPFGEDWHPALSNILRELQKEGRIVRYNDGTYWRRTRNRHWSTGPGRDPR